MTKYNAKKTYVDGIKFDSKAEGDYYILLKRQKENGEILNFELQPKFELLPKFEKHGEKHRAMSYIADFRVYLNDGTTEIIDVKGFVTTDSKLKHKIYCHKFDEPLKLVTFVQKRGGWILVSDNERLKRLEKKNK